MGKQEARWNPHVGAAKLTFRFVTKSARHNSYVKKHALTRCTTRRTARRTDFRDFFYLLGRSVWRDQKMSQMCSCMKAKEHSSQQETNGTLVMIDAAHMQRFRSWHCGMQSRPNSSGKECTQGFRSLGVHGKYARWKHNPTLAACALGVNQHTCTSANYSLASMSKSLIRSSDTLSLPDLQGALHIGLWCMVLQKNQHKSSVREQKPMRLLCVLQAPWSRSTMNIQLRFAPPPSTPRCTGGRPCFESSPAVPEVQYAEAGEAQARMQ